MTSNIGTQHITEDADAVTIEARVTEALRGHFRPEFLNRIDETVIFHRLDPAQLGQIVDIQLERIAGVLATRGLSITVTDRAKAFLAERGFDPAYGARPLKRAIQTHLMNQLAVALLEGRLSEGDHVTVDVDDDGESLAFEREQAGVEQPIEAPA
jgi:ATP-dependent Clp protease ATP-binding subunit ClpB